MDTKRFYRRNLPHIQGDNKKYFLTFCTHEKRTFSETDRNTVLETILGYHTKSIYLYCAVVMPDHVHIIFEMLPDGEEHYYTLAEVMRGIKSTAAHRINKLTVHRGGIWQRESFDHILRSSESIREKIEYICNNPVRRGLVTAAGEYRWLWVNPEAK